MRAHHGGGRGALTEEPPELRSPQSYSALTGGNSLLRDRVCALRIEVHDTGSPCLWAAAVVEQSGGGEDVRALQAAAGHCRCVCCNSGRIEWAHCL